VPNPTTTLSAWLDDLGLARYAGAFAAQEVSFDLLPELGDADLKELGVAALGDRKRLLKAIASLTPQAPAAAALRPAIDAERRQLTVMFCDMVGSTALSGRLDPEELQDVVRGFHAAVAAAVAPYDGHVAQLLGDGVLVYFGYPHAHEDDAERAVRAALAALRVVAQLAPHASVRPQIRIGIATGRVVVGQVGAGTPAAEQTASGETPNLAARLQGQAGPGEIVIADETRRLVGASFDLEPLGALELKGFAGRIDAWRVRGEHSVASRFEAQHQNELTPLIGRASEVQLLLERWALARDGEGQVVLLAGEAGIGKSRITHTLRERLANERAATVVLQCSPYFRSSALYPLVQYLERVTCIAPADPPQTRVDKLARLAGAEIHFPAASFGYLLRLMGLPDGGRIPGSGDSTKLENAQMLQAPIDLLRGLSRHHPVLLLIEDAHWIDPTTDELVARTLQQLADARVLVLITCRPGYTPGWDDPPNLTRLTLNRLGQKQCAALVDAVTAGRTLPPEVLAEIMRKTDGIPLFVEELTKTVVQSGLLVATPAGYRLDGPLPALAIPSTLQDSLMARLDRLAPAKEVAQVGALIGREFSRRLLGAVLQVDEAKLDAALDDLVHAELVLRRDAGADVHYTFKHALIRDTAADSLLRSQRVLRHHQIAATIEQTEPDIVANQPELLAHHWQEGGGAAAAFRYWCQAGDLGARRLAFREAATHYQAALALLPRLDGGVAGGATELDLQVKLGALLMQTDGFGAPQTVRSFERARELALQLGRIDAFVIACAGVSATLWSEGRFREAIEVQEQLAPRDLARLNPMGRVFREVLYGLVLLHRGEFESAWSHMCEARRVLDDVPAQQRQDIGGVDARVVVLAQCVAIRHHQGYLDQADAMTTSAIDIAEQRGHAPTRLLALGMARWRAFRRDEHEASVRLAREALALAEQLGFRTRIATSLTLLGRALVAAGDVDAGAAMLREGYARRAAVAGPATASEYASQAADVLINAGRGADALEFVLAGEQVQREIDERHFEAELLRQRGRLVELGVVADGAGSAAQRAEAFYRGALEVSRLQGAKLFELRTATDLARLLASTGRAGEGQALLQPVYGWFSEGHGHPDLARARALLA
jgi:class 3 adenylate cyclase